MPTPRTRQRSPSSPWPQLSLFTIYSSSPLIEPFSSRLSDEELEAAKILYFYSMQSSGSDQDLTPERKRRLLGTVMGVADFAKMMTATGQDNVIRSVKSSKRRMVWFEAEPGIFIHALFLDIPQLRNDMGGKLQQLQLRARALTLARNGSISRRLKNDGKEQTMANLDVFWHEWVTNWDLLNELGTEQALRKLIRGLPMSPILTPPTLTQLTPLLTQLSASNPSFTPILLHKADVLHIPTDLPPFISNFESLEALVHLLLTLQATRLLSIFPPVDPDTEAPSTVQSVTAASNWTTSALSYLDPRNVALPSFPSATTSASSSFLLNPFKISSNKSTSDASSQELRKDFSELRRQSRRLPTHSRRNSSISPAFDGGALRSRKETREGSLEPGDKGADLEVAGEKESTTTWGLRSVSKSFSRLGAAFIGGGSASGSGSNTPIVKTELSSPTLLSSERQSDPDVDPPKIPTPSPLVREEVSAVGDSPPAPLKTEGAQTPGTPAVELAPDVNEDDLLEALKGLEDEAESVTTHGAIETVEVTEAHEAQDTEHIAEAKMGGLQSFTGENDETIEVRLTERGPLTLALVSRSLEEHSGSINLQLLKNRAERLLEAVETIIDAATPPTSISHPGHAVKSEGRIYSQFATSLHGKSGSESENADTETICAFLDAYGLLESPPSILESLTRLPSSSNWVNLTRSFHTFPSTPTLSSPRPEPSSPPPGETSEAGSKVVDVFAILPAKNARGRETTLVEAAEGSRRIERKWVAQRCGP